MTKKVEILCPELEHGSGGIATYTNRAVEAINKSDRDWEAEGRIWDISQEADIANVQYEPGMINIQSILNFSQVYTDNPIVITCHHSGGIQHLMSQVDGVIFHTDMQRQDKDWDNISKIIPHPSVVFPEKEKEEMRDKYDLPKNKTIIATHGFVFASGKSLPSVVEPLLRKLKEGQFLYLITSLHGAGDRGRVRELELLAEKYGNGDNFRIDTAFEPEEIFNEKLQACDLLWDWNVTPKNFTMSSSGSAADMYGARRPLVVKGVPHFWHIGQQDGVYVAPTNPEQFANNIIELVDNIDNLDSTEPEWLSWDNMIDEYLDYFEKKVDEYSSFEIPEELEVNLGD